MSMQHRLLKRAARQVHAYPVCVDLQTCLRPSIVLWIRDNYGIIIHIDVLLFKIK